GAVLFVAASNLTNHDYRFGLRIVIEQPHHIEVLETVHWVSPNPHAAGLPQALLHQLPDCLVGEGAGARHHTHRPPFVDMARHDANLDLVGCDHAGAVGADQLGASGLHLVAGANHVADGNAFRNADHQIEPGLYSLVDRGRRIGRGHIDHRGRGPGCRLGLRNGIEDRYRFEVLSAFPRRNAGYEATPSVGVDSASASMELSGFASNTLRDDPGALVDEDRHFPPSGVWLP